MRAIYLTTLLLSVFFFTHCQDDDEVVIPDDAALISTELVFSASPELTAQWPQLNGPLFSSGRPTNGIDFFKIEYATTGVDGDQVTASGLVALPQGETEVPLAVVHQQTVLNANQVPSRLQQVNSVDPAALALAATGVAVVLPDYLGFGSSENLDHPYQHADTYGSSGYDMLIATRELLEEREITTDGQLYLTGYSAGADATVALHRHIEAESDWEISWSAAGGGAYDKLAIATAFAEYNDDVQLASLFVWIIQGYNDIYGLNRPWSDYLTPANAARISGKPDQGGEWLNLGLDTNPQNLLAPSFREGVLSGTDTEYLAALADNDLTDWSPSFPITLYHGDADISVPIIGAQNAQTKLGASGQRPELVTFAGANHTAAFALYLNETVAGIQSRRP